MENAIINAKNYTEEMRDFTKDEPWRIFRIMAEFVESFETMSKEGPAITVFGSARTKPEEDSYKNAMKIGQIFAKNGYGVITGGGPGIMEAAHKGAYESGGHSVGLNIKLPFEQVTNPYQSASFNFHYFFIRKVCFLKYSVGFVVYPGGFGTLDELFETLTLIQTEKLNALPVVLVGKKFWGPMLDWIKNTMLADKRISEKDLDLFYLADTPEEASQYIFDYHNKGLVPSVKMV